MHPKYPLKAYDGSTYSDISQFNVSEGAIEPNGVINLISNQNVFDIRDYGAAVDGVTDDAEAVQAAIQAAIAVGGGTIFFPPGTTRIATGTPQVVAPANVFGHYIFEGVGANSKIWIDEMGYYSAITLANIRTATVRDLVFIGTQDNVAENTGQGIIQFATCNLATFERVGFYGLAAAGTEGVIYCYNSAIRFQDCFFGGCVSPSAAVVNVPNCTSFVWENNTITDYGFLDGIGYNKSSVYGNTQHWIKVIAVDGVPLNGMVNSAWSVRNSRFDENTSDCLVSFSSTRATADQSLIIENCSFNGGFDNKPSIKTTGLVNVTLHKVWVGYYVPSSNPTFSSLIAHNCDQVTINGLIHGTNNVDVLLTGTTKRLHLRECQNVTITNTANSYIDADQAMPATASAASLAPLGKRTHVTGNINITSITTTNLKVGDEITLIFDSTPTLTDGNNIKAAGNLVATADDTWTGVFDGTNVYEIGRSVN